MFLLNNPFVTLLFSTESSRTFGNNSDVCISAGVTFRAQQPFEMTIFFHKYYFKIYSEELNYCNSFETKSSTMYKI